MRGYQKETKIVSTEERPQSRLLCEQLEREERAHEVRMAVLRDEEFMAGVRQAMQAECDGEEGTPWPDVKRKLGIV
jgi:hypothetical protein